MNPKLMQVVTPAVVLVLCFGVLAQAQTISETPFQTNLSNKIGNGRRYVPTVFFAKVGTKLGLHHREPDSAVRPDMVG